ncbi:MAG: HAMP domain-containing histidine kinase, partial [Campylobacterales bacterium]|nr:HAMP domain-containing histidine kinase [Campylobacterales bacterium]
DSYPYPAFIKNQKEYIHTSCGNLKNPNTILVVKANKDILQNELDDLKLKIFLFMIITFFINLFIAFILAKISIQPIKEANNRFKTFVDDIIHDLNAPISAIEINLESVQKDYDEKKVQRIDKSLQSIKNIYCNLESILHSQYKNNEETIELHKLCADIIFEFKPLFGDAEFLIDIPNIKIQINRFIFERILVNILQNSVKYSIDKPKIKLGFDDANQFFIQDNGIGIEDINKVLLRGVQSNNNSQGYGLGLSIVQRLSEQLDIEFKIVSKKEQGTTFYFNLKNHLIRSNEH